jgi:arylsulfatase A-like enzyme
VSRTPRPVSSGRPVPGPLLAVLLVAAAVTGLSGCGGEPPLTILLVSLDTTRPDHLSAYGYDRDTTPTLARLAREGTLFTHARSTSSWTLPAHMSLFTGLPPGLHDVVIDFQSLDRGRRTLGEIFHQAGFGTAGVFSAPYVHGKYGFDRGMDYYERGTQEPMVFDLPPAQQRQQIGLREQIGHQEVTSPIVTDRALSLLDRLKGPRKLCFLHYFDAHYDYMAPPRIASRFLDKGYTGPITGKNAETLARQLGEQPAAADLAQLEGYYDAELAWIDENLAKLLERQTQRGELEQTLVVVVADHGEAFYEHGRYGHRYDLHDEVLRVPLIVWAPGRVPAGRVIDENVSIVDVLPTLMDYAGLPPDRSLDGRSLKPLIDGGHLPPRPVTAALSFFPPAPPKPDHYDLSEALVQGDLKLVRKVQVPWSPDDEHDIGQPPRPGTETDQVFDLAADPGEQHDLVGAGDRRVGPLTKAFEAERDRQRERLALFQPEGSGEPITDLTLDEHLRANGYLERGQ